MITLGTRRGVLEDDWTLVPQMVKPNKFEIQWLLQRAGNINYAGRTAVN
ncbi:MAG: hypothetical protein ACLRS3_02815 [Veillonella parvula]